MDDNYDAESLNNENNNVVASDNTRVATNYIKEDLVADVVDEEFSLTDAISDNDDSEVVSDSKAVSGGDDFNKEDYFNPKVKNDNVKVCTLPVKYLPEQGRIQAPSALPPKIGKI